MAIENMPEQDRTDRLRERAFADHARTVTTIESEERAAAQGFAARRAQAGQALQRELTLLDTRFSEAWKQMIAAGVAPQYRANPAATGKCTFGGRVPHGDAHDGSMPENFAGIDLSGAVRDTYEKIRAAGVPVAHVPGLGGIGLDVADPAHTRFNAQIAHDLPDCSAEDFEVQGYQVMIDNEGPAFRFSVTVWWRSRSIVEAPPLNPAALFDSLQQLKRESLLRHGGIIVDAGPTGSGKTMSVHELSGPVGGAHRAHRRAETGENR